MDDSAKRLTPSWKIAMAMFPCLLATASAEPLRNAETVPTSPVAVSKDPDSLRQGGHNSITLSHQQSVIQCMDLVRDAIDRKDYLAAMPLMEQVLSEPDSFVPMDATTEVGSHEFVRRLIEKLPADFRQRLSESHRVAARVAWDLARTKRSSEIAEVLQKFDDMPLAVEAWWWLGSYERDHARFQLAAAAFARAGGHPQANRHNT